MKRVILVTLILIPFVSAYSTIHFSFPSPPSNCPDTLVQRRTEEQLKQFRAAISSLDWRTAKSLLENFSTEGQPLSLDYRMMNTLLWAVPRVILNFKGLESLQLENLITHLLRQQQSLIVTGLNQPKRVFPRWLEYADYAKEGLYLLGETSIRASFYISTKNALAILDIFDEKGQPRLRRLKTVFSGSEIPFPLTKTSLGERYASYRLFHSTVEELLSGKQGTAAGFKDLRLDLTSEDLEANQRARRFLGQILYVLLDTITSGWADKIDRVNAWFEEIFVGSLTREIEHPHQHHYEHPELNYAEAPSMFEWQWLNRIVGTIQAHNISAFEKDLTQMALQFPTLILSPIDGADAPDLYCLALTYADTRFAQILDQTSTHNVGRALQMAVLVRRFTPALERLLVQFASTARNFRNPMGETLMFLALKHENYEAAHMLRAVGLTSSGVTANSPK